MGKYIAGLIVRVLHVHLVENYDLSLSEGEASGRSKYKMDKWQMGPETWINHPFMELRCERKVGGSNSMHTA